MKKIGKIKAVAAFAVIFGLATPLAFASPATDVTQLINAGTLSTDILDASRVAVSSPSFSMSNKAFSFDCQSGGGASTGSLGSNTQRLYTNNPDGADNGWTLTIAATGGATARWANGGASQFFDFNDTGGSGCTDGGDADAQGGQLTIDPSVGTVTTDCGSCGSTGITKGSSSAFNQGTLDSITLVNAAAGSDDIWRGYLTGATLSQTIPAEQAADSYTLNMTLTATAL